MTPEQIWQAALGELRLQMSPTTFATRLRRVTLSTYNADTHCFTIEVQDEHTQAWLETHLQSSLQRILAAISQRPAQLIIKSILETEETEVESEKSDDQEQFTQFNELKWSHLGVPDHFATKSLATLDWSRPALQKPELRNYVAEALACFDSGFGLTLIGPSGTGKTHLTVGLLKLAVQAGLSVYFTEVSDSLDTLRATFDATTKRHESAETIVQNLVKPDVLVLDDLRPNDLTAWASSRLARILSSRWASDKPTLITSNYTPDEWFRPADRSRQGLDEGTLSRAVRAPLTLQLIGDDYRLIEKQKFLTTLSAKRTVHMNRPDIAESVA